MPEPVRLDVVMDKPKYKVGEKVEVNLVIHNVSKKDLAVCRARWDGNMAASANVKLFYKGKEVQIPNTESSMPTAQVIVGNEVTSDRFQYLSPRQYTNVFWIRFTTQLRDLVGTEITKANYGEWQSSGTPLKPGEYVVKGTYSFDKRVKTGFPGPRSTYEFTPSARKLFDMSYKGTLHATGKFIVEP